MSTDFAGLISHPITRFLRNLCDLHNLNNPFLPDHPLEVLHRASHSGSAGSTTEHGITCGSWSHPMTRDQDFLHQRVNDTLAQHFESLRQILDEYDDVHLHNTRVPQSTSHCRWMVQGTKTRNQNHYHDVAAALRTHHDLTNAAVIARKLNRFDSVMKGTEWLFLGRIKKDAILHQMNFDDRLYLSLRTFFPSFGTCTNLKSLRNRVREDSRRCDQWVFDGSDPAADDGLRCAFVANNFGLDLRNQKHVYAWLVKEMWSWKEPFMPTVDQVRRFEENVSRWAIDREEP